MPLAQGYEFANRAGQSRLPIVGKFVVYADRSSFGQGVPVVLLFPCLSSVLACCGCKSEERTCR